MSRLRQRLYNLADFHRLAYAAVFGMFSKDEYSEADGVLPDISYKIIFGNTGTLAADTTSQMWPPAGTSMGLPTSAEILDIVSSSIQDDSGGTGIDGVFIEGLDDDYLPQSELVLLDGQTTVNSVNSYRHVSEINCLNITTSGTTNAGSITITNTTSGDTLGYVAIGDSISKHGQFLIPAGYNGIILDLHTSTFRASGSGARRAEVDLVLVPLDGGNGDRIEYITLKNGSSSESTSDLEFHVPIVIGERVMICPTAYAEANNTIVSATYGVLLVRDTVDIDTIF